MEVMPKIQALSDIVHDIAIKTCLLQTNILLRLKELIMFKNI
jgi:hypothetical protein